MASLVVARNTVDVIDLVVDLVDVDIDVDLTDVDLVHVDLKVDVELEVDLVDVDLVDVVSLSSGFFLFSGLLPPAVLRVFGPQLFRQYFCPAVFGASLYASTQKCFH